MRFRWPSVVATVLLALGLAERDADAAAPWVDRPITLPRLVFAGNFGVGVGHTRAFAPVRNVFGPGLNLEGALGVTDRVELGLRTGIRFGDDAKIAQADAYGRTLWTETYGVGADTVANPEFKVRWAAYSGRVVEVGLDGRIYLPIETNTRVGLMFGVPLAFHIGRSVRIDTGAYVPVVFYRDPFLAFSVPAYLWFQVSPRVWLGPMTAVRFIDPGVFPSRTDVLVGFGFGYQAASAVDLKAMLLFPQINADEGARVFGAGFGVELRIE